MAKGDTFTVNVGDEVELTFQLNLKRAELQKRRDASQFTHVTISFDSLGNPPQGDVRFEPLGPDVTDPTRNEVLPITSDDPKFVRLYRVGLLKGFAAPISELRVRASVKLVPKEGELTASSLPGDPELCTIIVKGPKV
ncbi:MAG: hypothetical protein JNJ80_09010 [Gemmatimonadetes bacterium]|nr:hypothetical protein [Gemmatimonadota bacterium]MCC7132062.1 hypothetical protein [Gemmatimonadales bacterium]